MLAWTASSAVAYDVYFGTSNPPPLMVSGTANAFYTPPLLAGSTTYFWQIVARNSVGMAAGPIWSLTTAATRGGSLPDGWTSEDVGAPGVGGGASAAGGVFTVRGGGTIWGTADSFQFVDQPIAGDVAVTARVTSLRNTSPFAKAGLMIRGSTAPGAPHVILDVRPTGDLEFMARTAAGSATTFLATAFKPAPTWLRLVRKGTTITAFVSLDEASWTLVGWATLDIGSAAVAGLITSSSQTSAVTIATFDNVSVANP
jgi:regulation of enolase protein 1 (concanavalin A-like superfamily)